MFKPSKFILMTLVCLSTLPIHNTIITRENSNNLFSPLMNSTEGINDYNKNPSLN